MKKVILFCITFLLATCGPIYVTDYEIVPPHTKEGMMCANNCLLVKQNCEQSCSLSYNSCHYTANLEAQNQYLEYVNNRQREGKPIKKTRSDFYGMTNCDKSECTSNCTSNYSVCHTNCGGQVIPHQRCTAFCK